MIQKKLFLVLLGFVLEAEGFLKDVSRYDFAYPAYTYLPLQQSQFGKYAQSILPLATASIGVYAAKDYNFPATYGAVIELEPTMLINKLPQVLEQALQAAAGMNYTQFVSNSQNSAYSFIVIAPFLFNKQGALEPIYNVVYHFFYELISKRKQFVADMLMGLFDPKNISGTDANGISLNRFGQLHMSTHPEADYAISPNNATFRVDTQKLVASFWLAALAPNKKQLSITLFVLLPENNILEIVRQTPKLPQISNVLSILENSANAYHGQDGVHYLTIMNQIKNILTVPQSAKELQPLLEVLHKQLRRLQALVR